jgi:hypothetical protein
MDRRVEQVYKEAFIGLDVAIRSVNAPNVFGLIASTTCLFAGGNPWMRTVGCICLPVCAYIEKKKIDERTRLIRTPHSYRHADDVQGSVEFGASG